MYHHVQIDPPGITRRTLLTSAAAIVAGTAAASLTSTGPAHATGIVDITDHGADPTGVADSTAAIRAADTAAAATGDTVWFPAGTYSAYGLRPSASWEGATGSVIVNRSPSSDKFSFVRISSRHGLSFTGLTFDGAVSADPASWSSTTINTFTGAIPCFVENSSQLTFSNCIFRNGTRSGLRLHSCSEVVISDCTFTHVRDPWGDGSYVSDCTDVSYLRCTATDHTRIGFVADAAIDGISGTSYQDCDASNGHHASILYGGTEYNAGFWTENSTGTSYDNCTATSQTHFGINVQTGDKAPGTAAVTATVTDCAVSQCDIGVRLGSFGVRSLTATVTATTAALSSASATAAVMVRMRHSTDSIGLVGCDTLIETGTASATSASHLLIDDGGTGTAGDVGLDGCTFSWQGSAPRTQDVLVTGSSHATIELADVTCAPYGCVEVTAVAPASPVVTATGTTVLC